MSSRLSSMQAQFRQKQLNEKEHKIFLSSSSQSASSQRLTTNNNGSSSLYSNSSTASSSSTSSASTTRVGNGSNFTSKKVIDQPRAASNTTRSLNLAPATTTARKVPPNSTLLSSHNSATRVTTSSNGQLSKAGNRNPVSSRQPPVTTTKKTPLGHLDRSATYSMPTSSRDLGHGGTRPLLSSSSSKPSSSLFDTHKRYSDENGNELWSTTTSVAPTTNRAAGGGELNRKMRGLSLSTEKTSRPPPVRAAAASTASSVAPPRAKSTTVAAPIKRTPITRTPLASKKNSPPPGTTPCSVCSRYFATDRIEKHEVICKKTASKKRKIFDPTKMRMKGTEAEPYLKVVVATKNKPTAAKAPTTTSKANWRKKHEDFIRTIRLAKEFNAHVKAGGNPSDLPPPPPSDYSDYVQCPHCSRKFSQGAAERHIPKCAGIKSNKR